jgi:uncharacterized protein
MGQSMTVSTHGSAREKGPFEVGVAGELLVLLPERAVYWPRQNALLVADLHWGKDEALRREGVPIPEGVLGADLSRLQGCIERFAVSTVYVIGDLIHNRVGVSAAVIDQVAAWRDACPVRLRLVPGNHDRHVPQLPPAFRVEATAPVLPIGGLKLIHDPTVESTTTGSYPMGGHLHPSFRIRSRHDRITLPCFYFGPRYALLPAFSEFTGCQLIDAEKGARVFVTDGTRVFAAVGPA